MDTRNFAITNSEAITNIAITGEDVVVTYKDSNKDYSYVDTTGNFVNLLEDTIKQDGSVGRLVNRAVREDQTLRLTAI
jgi:hypothetical protein